MSAFNALLVADLPPELRDSEVWTVVLDPSGVFVVASEPLECPGCHRATCLFIVEKPGGEALRYRCLVCVGGPHAAA